ncbi:MAG: hypothetical protein KC933_37120, partial [Myxococcales bacterium]|nr:hypothetical protein [Myxococcales bacterium]
MRGVEWSPGAETSRLVWPDGRPVDGLLQHHWRLGEDEAGRPLYAGLFDHGAGWRRRWTARTHGAACAWALLRKAEGGAEAGFEILQPDLLSANPRGPDDAAPGGGSVVRTRLANGAGAEGTAYALFYTGRTLEVPRVVLDQAPEHAEAVQLAVLRRERLAPGVQDAVWRVRRTEFRLAPDPAWHVTEAGDGRPVFRDPFVFQDLAGGTFMVVASRARSGPPGRDAALTVYAIEGALDDAAAYRRVGAYAPGRYAVLEAPHVA